MIFRAFASTTLLFLFLSAAASADVAITWKSTNAQGTTSTPETVRELLRGERQREDRAGMGQSFETGSSVIRDLAALREFTLWHTFQQYRESAIRPKTADEADAVEGRVKPRSGFGKRGVDAVTVAKAEETQTIAGLTCRAHDVTATAAGGRVTLKGRYWAAARGAGTAEYLRFHRKLRGFSSRQEEEPNSVKLGRAELWGIRDVRDAFMRAAVESGFPCSVQYEITGMGRVFRYTREAAAISTSRLARDAFAVPPSYKRR